jgi:hypothetical protein
MSIHDGFNPLKNSDICCLSLLGNKNCTIVNMNLVLFAKMEFPPTQRPSQFRNCPARTHKVESKCVKFMFFDRYFNCLIQMLSLPRLFNITSHQLFHVSWNQLIGNCNPIKRVQHISNSIHNYLELKMRRRTTSSEKKPLYSSYGSSWNSYGTSNGYQSSSQPLLSSVDYNRLYDSPPTSPTEKTNNYTMKSEIRQDSHIGSIKSNYYSEVRSQSNTTNWIFEVIQEMLRYIYTSIAQIRVTNCTSNTAAYPEPELKLDPNTQ